MCGIVGGWFCEVPRRLESRIAAATRALLHRGPDDSGYEIHDQNGIGVVVLGHTRLSIIDLSAGGHQPMHSPEGRYSLIYNGEIYNYRELRETLRSAGHQFTSDSDTEVLLASWAAWGESCLTRLKGMFAFVIYDRIAKTLTCARDGFGIKPFFYMQRPGLFLFSSEVRALLNLMPCSPEPDHQRAYDYLVHGRYDDQERTFFEQVRHLLPAHVMTIDLADGSVRSLRRWWWPRIEERPSISFSEAAEEIRELFLQNIRLHLRSDVPLGAALSGGLDSSAVVCAMRKAQPDSPIHTFSYIAQGSAIDEEVWVDRINKHVGAIPHKVLLAPEELAVDLDDMIRVQGEPFGSTSIYAQYRVFKLARDHGITVTLDGQGADELLAGYHGYPGARMKSLLEQGRIFEAVGFARAWSAWPDRSMVAAALAIGEQLVPASLRGRARRLAGRNPEPPWLDSCVLRDLGVRFSAPVPGGREGPRGRKLVAALRSALTERGLGALLRHGDRNSMRWSIESRVPFLTTDMAELVLGLPEEFLISARGETKHVFRSAMRGLVPDVVLDRKDKIGFQTPEREWLRVLGPRVTEWLEGCEKLGFLRADLARNEVRRIIQGQRSFSFTAWRLINYCRWVQVTME